MPWPFYTTFQTSNNIADERRKGNLNNTKTFKFLVFLSYPSCLICYKALRTIYEFLHFIAGLN